MITELNYYKAQGFDRLQMMAIEVGLSQGVDVTIYADTRFTVLQMNSIRRGLLCNINIAIYATLGYSHITLEKIRYIRLNKALTAEEKRIQIVLAVLED